MKLKLTDVAEFDTRTIPDTSDGSGYTVQRIRGWWSKNSGNLLGKTRKEAEDAYAITHAQGHEIIEWAHG